MHNFENFHINHDTDANSDVAALKLELQKQQNRKNEFQLIRSYAPITGILFLLLGLLLTFYFERDESWALFGGLYFLISIAIFIAPLTSTLNNQIDYLKNEIEIISLDMSDLEQRAERLYKSHELELRRYYSQILSHSSMIFYTGLFCMLVGFSIVGYSLYQLWSVENRELEYMEKIVPATFGVLSGIITNFVGAIFLRMFTSVSDSLTVFHERLVETHKLYYANFLISKISDTKDREVLLGALASNSAIFSTKGK